VSRSRFLSAILINGVVFGGAFLALGVRLLKQKQSNAKV